jgi:SulP family sulfate permease
MATFLLVIFRDLTEGILVGFGLGALLFLHRMTQSVGIEKGLFDGNGMVDQADSPETAPTLASNANVVVYRISGAFFFGAAAAVVAAIERLGERPKAYVLDFSGVSFLDSSAAAAIEGFVRKAHRQDAAVYVAAPQPSLRRTLLMHGVRPPLVKFRRSLNDALASANAARATRE